LKKITLQITLWSILGCSAVYAQNFKRFELHIYGGHTLSGNISLEKEDGPDATVSIDGSYNLGAALGVNINSQDSIEASWQRQFTEGRVPSVIYDPSC